MTQKDIEFILLIFEFLILLLLPISLKLTSDWKKFKDKYNDTHLQPKS